MATVPQENRLKAWAMRHERSRIVAFCLSLALVFLVFLMLIDMGLIDLDRGRSGARLTAVQLGAPAQAQKRQVQKQAAAPHAARVAARVPPPVPHPLQSPSPSPAFIHLTSEDLASSDISKLPKGAAGGKAGNSDSAATFGPGEGPGGAHLFNAEWLREPRDAELGPYLQHNAPPGSWATIECRTVEHYHVENCQELSESPPGSGLARALRQAAWQFLVRPPRVNGQAMVGAWVKIHFDFISRGGGAEDGR